MPGEKRVDLGLVRAVVLSGVEAISNGVPAFKKPESRNASQTLAMMAGILAVGFLFNVVL